MSDIVISVESVSKKYRLGVARHDTLRDRVVHAVRASLRRSAESANESDFWALRDVSFDVKQGEVLGIIGRNGAGKSTLLKILSRITEPTTGRIALRGRVASLLEVGTGFHPELSGRENIFLNGAILGMSRAEIRRKFDEIVAFAEVERFLDTPVKHYSSGMYVRLAFAVAAHLEPEILIVDEVLAVGDIAFQKKCLGKMEAVATCEGRTILFVSHNLQQVRQLCTSALLLEAGAVLHRGGVHQTLNRYHESLENSPVMPGGKGSVRIERIAFVDDRGGVTESVDRASEVRMIVEFASTEVIQRPLVAIAVLHGDRQAVFSEYWSENQPLPPGRHQLQGRFPARNLKTEPYFMTVYLYDGERCLDTIQGQPLPEIVDPQANPLVESRRWGVARIPVSWNFSR